MRRHENPRNDGSSKEAETITARTDELEANRVTKRIYVPDEVDNIIATTDGDTASVVFADGQVAVSFTVEVHNDAYDTGTLVFTGGKTSEVTVTAQFFDGDGAVCKTLYNPEMDTLIVHDDGGDDDE